MAEYGKKGPDRPENDALFSQLIQNDVERAVLAEMRQNKSLAIEIASNGFIETDSGPYSLHENHFGNSLYRLVFLSFVQCASDSAIPWSNQGIRMKCNEISRSREWNLDVSSQLLNSLAGEKVESRLDVMLKSLDLSFMRRHLAAYGRSAIQYASLETNPYEAWARLLSESSLVPKGDSDKVLHYGDEPSGFLQGVIDKRRKYMAGEYNPLNFPWASWNAILDPLEEGKYFSLVIPTGQGKSTVAANLSEYWSKRNFHVGYVLTEDQRIDFLRRQMSRWSKVPLEKIKSGNLTDEEMSTIERTDEMLEETLRKRIHFVEAYGKNQQEILHYLRRLKDSGKLDVAIVDYMNGMKKDNYVRGQSEWSRGVDEPQKFVDFSNTEHIPFVIADQFSKAGEREARDGMARATGQHGIVQKTNCAKTILVGARLPVKDKDGEWIDGRRVAKHGDPSTVMQWRVDKQNDGRVGSFQQRFIGWRFMLQDIKVEGERDSDEVASLEPQRN